MAPYQPSRRATAIPVRSPAPILGWDAKSAVSEVQPGYAIRLDNMIPKAGVLEIRKGYKVHATGIGGPVKSLLPLHVGETKALLAFGGGTVRDVSSGGAPSAIESDFTSDRWRGVQFRGRLLLTSEGDEPPQTYDGATFAATGWTGVGLTPANLSNLASWKQRLWYVEARTATAWYGVAGNITGVLAALDLSSVSPVGGNLVAIGSWSRDAATSSPDELIAFVFDSGAVLVYQGTDPTDSAAWSIAGRYVIAPPLGADCLSRAAGDLLILTRQGYASLSRLTVAGRDDPTVYLSDPINGEVSRVANLHAAKEGWQALRHATGGFQLFNVPTSATTAEQHVLTNTGAWARFTGMSGLCWASHDDGLYFGAADGAVYQADIGYTDAGRAISFDVRGAYENRTGALNATYKMARPALSSDGVTAISIGIATDFADHAIATPVVPSNAFDEVFDWNEAWGLPWGGRVVPSLDWQMVAGHGSCASCRVTGAATRVVRFHGVDLLVEPAAGL